jgi:asparagine synthase (glutamine-hydrolysing)
MTIFAGAYSLQADQELPQHLVDELRQHVSRNATDPRIEHRTPGFYAVNVDIGAFATPGEIRNAAGDCTLVAGEPLLADGEDNPEWTRAHDVAQLHRSFRGGDLAALRRASGTFCGLHYDAHGHRLALFVDKVGVRPLYVWTGPHYVVFATALRVLEALSGVSLEFDVQGVTELAVFSYALADRTPYRNISMLKPGESLRMASGKIDRETYWRWDGGVEEIGYDAAVDRAYARFAKAIARRQRGERCAAAFLSGGLDSRVIVGGLAANRSEVYTVNYAPDGSQDQVFGALVADKLGTHHTQIQTNADNVGQGYRKNAVNAWVRDTFQPAARSKRPPLIWSGDGGSVGMGNVYMTPQIVAAMERGAIDEAVALFTNGVPVRIYRRSSVNSVSQLPLQGMARELAEVQSPDAGRRFHLFLMANDQRRHLSQHFEDIDLERIEFQLPFFDADFLDSVLRLPNDWFMAHRFYMDWLARFPNGLDAIPWQAYPGHIPCTLPSPPGLKYQWQEYYDKAMYAQMRRATAKTGRSLLAQGRFPDHLISRRAVRLASLITGTGLRDYGYLIRAAAVYHRYWNAASASAAAA